jgi:hypothetical protein
MSQIMASQDYFFLAPVAARLRALPCAICDDRRNLVRPSSLWRFHASRCLRSKERRMADGSEIALCSESAERRDSVRGIVASVTGRKAWAPENEFRFHKVSR